MKARRKNIRVRMLTLLVPAICFGFVGCAGGAKNESAKSEADYDYASEDQVAAPAPEAAAATAAPAAGSSRTSGAGEGVFGDSDGGWGNIDPALQKIIRNASISMETKEFEKSLGAIEQAITSNGGYVEASEIIGNSEGDRERTANITARIPADGLDAFLKSASSSADVISQSISTSDVSGEYFDSQARKQSLEIQLQRLEAILTQAAELEDILKLETEIERVRYEIDSLTGNLKRWDNLVAYSTVNLYLRNIRQYETPMRQPQTLGERISLAFSQSIHSTGEFFSNMLVLIVSLLPALIVLGILAFIAAHLWRKNQRKRREKAKPDQPNGESKQ